MSCFFLFQTPSCEKKTAAEIKKKKFFSLSRGGKDKKKKGCEEEIFQINDDVAEAASASLIDFRHYV